MCLLLYVMFKLADRILKINFKVEYMGWYLSASLIANFVLKTYVKHHLVNMVGEIGEAE